MSTSPQPATRPAEAASRPAPFPDAPRIIYDRNPLVEVICQLRFPPVLRIEAQLPDAFQDRIRNIFPVYTDSSSSLLGGIDLPQEIVQILRTNLPAAVQRPPRAFSSEDGTWTVTLAKDFLALSAKAYRRWEDFRRYLEPAVTALEEVYAPAFYTRIGLRYRDVIRRSALGLQGASWRELLRHELAGELTDPDISESVEETATQTLLRLPEFEAKVRVQHGLTMENNESCYVIDNDLFTEKKTERADVYPTLQYFSIQAHRLFRWCISDRLHDAMGPQPLPPRVGAE